MRKPEKVEEEPPRPPGRVHPMVERWLAKRSLNETETLVVSFRENVRIPRFPEPAVGEPRDSPTNTKAMARTAELIRGIRAARFRVSRQAPLGNGRPRGEGH